MGTISGRAFRDTRWDELDLAVLGTIMYDAPKIRESVVTVNLGESAGINRWLSAHFLTALLSLLPFDRELDEPARDRAKKGVPRDYPFRHVMDIFLSHW